MVTEIADNQRQWRAIVALANANPADDPELAERFLELGVAFEAFDVIDGQPVVEREQLPSLARKVLPELRNLLRSLVTKRGHSRAELIVAKHERHIRVVKRHSKPGRPTEIGRGTFDDFLKALEKQGWRRSAKRILSTKRHFWTRIVFSPHLDEKDDYAYADPLDPICELARRDVLTNPGIGPVRICQLRSCGQFFVRDGFFARRGGRGKFCSGQCKSKYHPKSPEYMYRYKARKLLRNGGPAAIRRQMEKVRRRKLAPTRKRLLLAILHSVLRPEAGA